MRITVRPLLSANLTIIRVDMKLHAIRYSLFSSVVYPTNSSLSIATISSTEQSIFQRFLSTERVEAYCSHCRLLALFVIINTHNNYEEELTDLLPYVITITFRITT
jgi:hypothetical protein